MGTHSLRIGIDARVLAEAAPMGVSRYLNALLRSLADLAPQHDYFLYFCREGLDKAPFGERPFFQRILGRNRMTANPLLWQQCALPWALHKDKVDVLFSPYYCGPLFVTVPQIVCLHDISFVRFPQDFPSWIRFKPKLLAYPSCKWADHVITVSEFSRQEILREYGLPPSKVGVVYPGKETLDWPQRPSNALIGEQNLHTPFFLFVGSLLPRRQISCVLQALSKLPSEYRFVVVGETDAKRHRSLYQSAQAINVVDRMHILGHVSDEYLDYLYTRTLALISPSTYEGFGLPVLEAMARGVPVIAWDIPVMREVVGEAGVLIPAGDVEALARAMSKFTTDQELGTVLYQQGQEQANRFSWQRSAANFLKILDKTVVATPI